MVVSPWIVLGRFCSIRAWWAHVTVTPEARRTAVFSRGTLKGLIGVSPVGGQEHPSSAVGASLLWKNDQKNAKKKHTSEIMNKIIPHRSPNVTLWVWWPRNVDSRMMSRHHVNIVIITNIRPKVSNPIPKL